MQSDKEQDHVVNLNKVIGIHNYRGMLVEIKQDGRIIKDGIIYADKKEFDFYYDNLLKDFRKDIH